MLTKSHNPCKAKKLTIEAIRTQRRRERGQKNGENEEKRNPGTPLKAKKNLPRKKKEIEAGG